MTDILEKYRARERAQQKARNYAHPRDRFFTPAGRSTTVTITRGHHTSYTVEAFGWAGELLARRTYRYGTHRRRFAFIQARRWADQYQLELEKEVRE